MTRALAGLRAWWVQRVTAVYLLCGLVLLLIHFVWDAPRTYAEWRHWMAEPWVSVATALFFASLLLHVWVGLRDVILDYVHPVAARLVVLALLALGLAGMAIWVLQFLFVAGQMGGPPGGG